MTIITVIFVRKFFSYVKIYTKFNHLITVIFVREFFSYVKIYTNFDHLI